MNILLLNPLVFYIYIHFNYSTLSLSPLLLLSQMSTEQYQVSKCKYCDRKDTRVRWIYIYHLGYYTDLHPWCLPKYVNSFDRCSTCNTTLSQTMTSSHPLTKYTWRRTNDLHTSPYSSTKESYCPTCIST